MKNTGVFGSEIISSLVPEVLKFLLKKLITSCLSTKINHKIKNILGNIAVILLKLGSSNVPQTRHKT